MTGWRDRGATKPQAVKMARVGERFGLYARPHRLQAKVALYEELFAQHGIGPEVVTDMMVRKHGGYKFLLNQWPEALDIRLQLLAEHAPSIMWARDVIVAHPQMLAAEDVDLVARTVRQSEYLQREVKPKLPGSHLGAIVAMMVREDIERALKKRDKSNKERAKQVRLKEDRAYLAERARQGEEKHAYNLKLRRRANSPEATALRKQRDRRRKDVPKRLKRWQKSKKKHLAFLERRDERLNTKRVA